MWQLDTEYGAANLLNTHRLSTGMDAQHHPTRQADRRLVRNKLIADTAGRAEGQRLIG